MEPLKELNVIKFNDNICISKSAQSASEIAQLKEDLRSNCPLKDEILTTQKPEEIGTASPLISCDSNQKIFDLETKISNLELEINKTVSELKSTTSEFCSRFNDWENPKCKQIETTEKITHEDDHTEGYIMGVDSQEN
jgi:hypothetical protein